MVKIVGFRLYHLDTCSLFVQSIFLEQSPLETMTEQKKRVALVTGGSRGIGLGIALCLAKENFDIVINGRRDEAEVLDSIALIREAGARVLYCQADISSATDRNLMLEKIRGRFAALHVLVNNAGVAPKERKPMLQADEESFDRLIDINLKGPYFLTQSVARWMLEQKEAGKDWSGCIVNISSVSATVASPDRGDYCVSKAGVAMASRLWAACLGGHDIPVFEIRPGITQTDMTGAVKEKYDALLEQGLCVQARWGQPEDVGRAVACLARGDLAYSTGQVIMVDGGMTLPRL